MTDEADSDCQRLSEAISKAKEDPTTIMREAVYWFSEASLWQGRYQIAFEVIASQRAKIEALESREHKQEPQP